MGRLPNDIWLMIFRHIDDYRELLKLELVCGQWRQIMQKHGWKHLRRIANGRNHRGPTPRTLSPDKWVVPIGRRCGNNLVECNFYSVAIDSNLMRLLAANLSALRHLKFHCCRLENMDEHVLLDPFPEFGARLRSLTFYETKYHSPRSHTLLRHFPCLRHIGLDFLIHRNHSYANVISRHFSAHLRSIYLNYRDSNNSSDLEQMLAGVHKISPGLTALYLDTIVEQSVLHRISGLTNLRFLHMSRVNNADLLSLCLANLSHLRALQLGLSSQQNIPYLFRSESFRSLVHLRLSLSAYPSDNFELIGHLLSTVAPQLRSLSLDVPLCSLELSSGIGCQMLEIARNGNLEHLHVPCASFAIAGMDQLVRLCPNLHSINAQLSASFGIHQSSEVAELRRVVADQWGEGKRKCLPLRIWIRDIYGQSTPICHDPFLAIRLVDSSFVPFNPVLANLFRDEVFNGHDDGGTPSFMAECYEGVQTPRVPKTDLMIV